MSDDIKKILEQFNRIDAEMGGKNILVDDEATRLKGYRNIVEGRFAAITEKKRLNAQESKWNSKFGFMRSLNESTGFEKIDGKTFPVQTKTFKGTGTFKYTGQDRSEGVQNYIYPFTLIIDGDASGKPWYKEIAIYVKVSKQSGRLSYAKADGTSYQMPEGKELTFIKRHTPLGPYNLADVFSDKFGESEEFVETKKEKIGDESAMSEDHLEDCEPTDEFIAGSDVEECDDLEEGLAEDKLAHFRATAVNGAGLTFGFEFQYPNWNGVQEYAQKILDAKVAKDELHKKHGPWRATKIDIGYL